MSDIRPVIVVDEDNVARAALERLAAQALEAGMLVLGPEALDEARDFDVLLLAGPETPEALLRLVPPEAILLKPVRPGAVIDRARALLARSRHRALARSLQIGPYTLDPVLNVLYGPESGPPIRLTDKEKEILEILYGRAGEAIVREELLARVWGYSPDIETHTLETHIYRLRQKIETDPSRPVLLLTEGNGYLLAGVESGEV